MRRITPAQVRDPLLRERLNGEWQTITPQWLGASGNPAIGNGTLTGYYYEDHHGLAVLSVRVVAGSTTTFGTGGWSFAPPTALQRVAIGDWTGTVWARDTGTDYFIGVARILDAADVVQIAGEAGGENFFASATPFTWANTDELYFSISYRVE